MMTTNLFVIADVKQLRTQVVLEFYCIFFRTSRGVGVLDSAIFNSFHNRVDFGTILEGLRNFGGGGLNPQTPLGTSLVIWDVKQCNLLRCDVAEVPDTCYIGGDGAGSSEKSVGSCQNSVTSQDKIMRFVNPVVFYEITTVYYVYWSDTAIFIGRI